MKNLKLLQYISFIYFLTFPTAIFAGVVNPDISVLGQLNAGLTDDAESGNRNKATMELGETELNFVSNLNPYARGDFVISIGEECEVEEAYLTIFNGLPRGLGIKLGKYRLGFGRINPAHEHTLPFIEPPRVISQFLPGEESFNDVACQVSYLLPAPGSWASNLSFDLLKGATFHPEEEESEMGGLLRWTNSFLIDNITPLDIGISATQGTNNVEWDTKSNVYGADFKTKVPLSVEGKLTLQGEVFINNNDVVTDTAAGTTSNYQRTGFYAVADYRINPRYNFGLIYDQYQQDADKNLIDRTIKYFVGYSFLEESTLFRFTYEEFIPEDAPVVHTAGLQVLFTMGPHKAHKF